MAIPTGYKNITITFRFPNNPATGQPDKHAEPVVQNSCTEADRVGPNKTGIYWTVTSNLDPGTDDGLAITGITYYTNSTKTTTFQPAYLNAGQSDGQNYQVAFNSTAVSSETDLIYALSWADLDFPNEKFDPTLKVQPRNATEGAGG